MLKLLTCIISCIVVVGCSSKPAETTQHILGKEFTVEKLFTRDGCTVYRFMDGGIIVIIHGCFGADHVSTQSTSSCGKSCTRHEVIETSQQE